jgi:hypothetical protein
MGPKLEDKQSGKGITFLNLAPNRYSDTDVNQTRNVHKKFSMATFNVNT